MSVDAVEQVEQLRAFVVVERRHDVFVDAVEDTVELGEAALAVLGDGDDVATLVSGVGRAANPPAVFEVVARRLS
ncbi:hypothetical protein IU433_21545 [Nocardia puris]|uniref:hypothetical protein n=1 Tax=Nocardia puris TaxID=208602 RepID=UPI0012F50C7C|nr:hypothetical protein [Nocardia puris]MBF6214011.1 hypothetical protein [Nocardia puris]MBF6368692.1 hypothetical protein [Nocardia puris]MBF6461607.1 hypothetical protein [Nocardia puris]